MKVEIEVVIVDRNGKTIFAARVREGSERDVYSVKKALSELFCAVLEKIDREWKNRR